MDEAAKRVMRWAGGSAALVAAGTVGLAVWVAGSPPGGPRISTLAPCFTAGCSGTARTTTPTPTTTVAAAPVAPAKANPAAGRAPAGPPAPGPWTSTVLDQRLQAPIVSVATVPNGSLVMVGSDGGVFSVGQAEFFGSLSGQPLTQPIVAIAADPATGGYWLAGRDGGIFTFGDARYAGSAARHHPTSPIVAMAATPSGRGYWLASADGGIFTFGDAAYYGNAGAQHSHAFASIVAAPKGRGYWLTGRNGEVLAFGSARPVEQTGPAIVPAITTASSRPMARRLIRAEGRASEPQAIIRGSVSAYKRRDTGFDISQYQCAGIPAGGRPGIAIVQVTGGALDNGPNPCYRAEAAWAGKNLSAYLFMSGVPSPPTQSTLGGPAGSCSAADTACQGYNYGYNYTRYWVGYSDSQGVVPKLWWLDVENYSGWTDPPTNAAIIRGSLDALRSQRLESGIYSTVRQWNAITGGMRIRGEAEWTPGAGNVAGGQYSAQGFCAAAATHTFGGGHLKLVQWGYQGPFADSYSGPPVPYDQDFACP